MAGMLSRQCGMGNAECGMSGEGQCVSDLSLQFRIPHSALRIRNYRTIKLPDPLFPSLTAVTSVHPPPTARGGNARPAALMISATLESLPVHDTFPPARTVPPAPRSAGTNSPPAPTPHP